MDSKPGTSAQSDSVQNETVDDIDDDDPIQRILDDDSDEGSDDEPDSEFEESDLMIDEDFDIEAPKWVINTSGMRSIQFIRTSELLVPVPGDGNPFDWFSLLLDNVYLEEVCKLSNEYALEVLCKPGLMPNSRICKWKELSVPELKIFVGLTLHMGTIRLNRLQDYWKTDWLFDFPCFRKCMSRDRFSLILQCLHFSRIRNVPQTMCQSIQKVSGLVDYFNNKMRSIYYPQKELSLDEPMVLWRGRLYFKQYIKGKRHKYGIKLYTLTEHDGLIMKFLVYAGATDEEVGGKGHKEKVVMHLVREKLGNGHSVYMDSFYNSFSLSSKLLDNGTYCTGTLRVNRLHNPPDVIAAVLRKGETISRYREGVMIGKWKDKSVVTYISTEHENDMVDCLNRRGSLTKKPLPILHYNAYMSGVDRADQMMSYYPCDGKNLRWYKKIFVHVTQMLLLNSLYLYNKYNPKKTFYDFRLYVIRALLPRPVEIIEGPVQKKLRQAAHKLTKCTERDTTNRIKRKNCRTCWKTLAKKVKTSYICETCPDKPGLCIGQCFDEFHDNL